MRTAFLVALLSACLVPSAWAFHVAPCALVRAPAPRMAMKQAREITVGALVRAPAPRMAMKQAREITVGAELPYAECQLVKGECAAFDECGTISTTDDLLSKGKCIIVGMPGAFTPTCTSEHLPGFIRNARKFKSMGVRSINIVTTNDAFIMALKQRLEP